MAGFNPDQYIQEKSAIQAPAFDPDAYIQQKTAAAPPGLGEKITRGALSMLPAIGAVGGGVLGAGATGAATLGMGAPGGALVGAGLGAATGESLKNTLEHYLLGDQKTREDIYAGPVKAAGNGALAEMGGQAIGAVPGLIKQGLKSGAESLAAKIGDNVQYTPIANQAQVQSAADKLGISLPKGVLTDNPTYQKLEQSLAQSGSIPAKGIQKQYNQLSDGLSKAGSKISDLASGDSYFALGSKAQQSLIQSVKDNQKPVQELYQSVVPDLQQIPVDKNIAKAEFQKLADNQIFQTKDGAAVLKDWQSVVAKQPELNSLKELRSNLNASIGPSATPLDAKRVSAISNSLTSIRNNSINAMKSQFPESLHPEIDGLMDHVTLADQAHASNVNDLNSVKSVLGNKDINSPSDFLNRVSDMKEADLTQRLSNLDVGSMRNLQDKFPNVFDAAKTAKINDMIQGATTPAAGFNDARFLKQYSNLDQEMKDLIFTPQMQSHIDNLATVKSAIPPKLGPSGTPEGLSVNKLLSPKQFVQDLATKKALNLASAAPEIPLQSAQQMAPDAPATALQMAVRPTSQRPPLQLVRAADNQNASVAPTKGPEKWANDGVQKLIDHVTDPTEKQEIQNLRDQIGNDKKGRDLLIAASDLTPGSKAMEKILSQLKTKYGKDD